MKYDAGLLQSGKMHGTLEGIDKQVHVDAPFIGTDLCKVNRRFMGAGMSQSYAGIYWFEYYHEAHNFEYVVELGSQKGALSTYYANMAAITEQFFFDTFEIDKQQDWFNRPTEGVGHSFERLAELSPYINTYEQNVFDEDAIDHIRGNVDQYKTFIFCDGGHKQTEFATYAPMIKKGDRIAVHDWGTEIEYVDIRDVCREHQLVPDEPWARASVDFGTLIMPFRRKDDEGDD